MQSTEEPYLRWALRGPFNQIHLVAATTTICRLSTDMVVCRVTDGSGKERWRGGFWLLGFWLTDLHCHWHCVCGNLTTASRRSLPAALPGTRSFKPEAVKPLQAAPPLHCSGTEWCLKAPPNASASRSSSSTYLLSEFVKMTIPSSWLHAEIAATLFGAASSHSVGVQLEHMEADARIAGVYQLACKQPRTRCRAGWSGCRTAPPSWLRLPAAARLHRCRWRPAA